MNSDYRSQSDSSHSSVTGGGVDTTDFPSNNFRNDADSSDGIFAAHDEQGTQTVRRSSRQSVFPKNYNGQVELFPCTKGEADFVLVDQITLLSTKTRFPSSSKDSFECFLFMGSSRLAIQTMV
uniref:Uncharacterized protein n=1 Tax=Tanacetum cinerariifolium TaxID=118510 RepID=A0A6L2LA95_TANCI|nr:hypothetical protein [Tanacetum cinerariifolium]